MKRFLVFAMLLSLATTFSIGCDKKAETKKAEPAAATDAAKPAEPAAEPAAK